MKNRRRFSKNSWESQVLCVFNKHYILLQSITPNGHICKNSGTCIHARILGTLSFTQSLTKPQTRQFPIRIDRIWSQHAFRKRMMKSKPIRYQRFLNVGIRCRIETFVDSRACILWNLMSLCWICGYFPWI